MNREELSDKLRAIAVEQSGVAADKIDDDTLLLSDLDLDSLDIVELVLDVEDQFFDGKDTITDDEAASLSTFGELVELVQTKLA